MTKTKAVEEEVEVEALEVIEPEVLDEEGQLRVKRGELVLAAAAVEARLAYLGSPQYEADLANDTVAAPSDELNEIMDWEPAAPADDDELVDA